jgi:hypothetical protein
LVAQQQNEVENYVNSRYVCVQQATWRLLHLSLNRASPSVYRLRFHLEGEHDVTFAETVDRADLDREQFARSMMLDFFKFCSEYPVVTQDLTYPQAPSILSYHKKKGWQSRRRGSSIGRMYFANPSQG